jgi:dTMP kinase
LALFVSFEGGEGTGKTTQAELLVEGLRAAGLSVLPIHEPGSTRLGSHVREWLKRGLLGDETMSHSAELFLFASARSELVAKLIQPAIEKKDMVIVCDRYADSTTAYQGYGRRIPLGYVTAINELATQGILPDITFLLDCPPETGLERVGSFQMKLPLEGAEPPENRQRDHEGTRFEEESLEFRERVRLGYLEIAGQQPDRWCVIDAGEPVQAIRAVIWDRVHETLLGLGYSVGPASSVSSSRETRQ